VGLRSGGSAGLKRLRFSTLKFWTMVVDGGWVLLTSCLRGTRGPYNAAATLTKVRKRPARAAAAMWSSLGE
jgi:hypothetical protein